VKKGALDLALVVYGVVVAALFLGQMARPDAWVYRELFTLDARLWVGGLTKLAALVVGGVFAWRVANRMKRGSAARFAWRAVALWLLLWSAGQASLGVYQWVLDVPTPFPSVADPFFVAGYVSLVVAFTVLVRAYSASGLALGSESGHLGLGLVVGALAVGIGYVVLAPIVRAGGTEVEIALNLAYPGFDLVAVVPAAVLLRITMKLRGGALFWVWSLTLGGFLSMAIGDVLYAYLTMLGVSHVDPLIDVAFMLGYGLVARGVVEQHRLSS
jgi:hypothetical protein